MYDTKLSFCTNRKKSYGRAARRNITTWTKTCTSSSRCSPRRLRPTPGWVTLWRRLRSFSYQYAPFVRHIRTLFSSFPFPPPESLVRFSLAPANSFPACPLWSVWVTAETAAVSLTLFVSYLHCNSVSAVGVCVESFRFSMCDPGWEVAGITEKSAGGILCMGQTPPWQQHGAYLLFFHSLWMIFPMLRAMMISISPLIMSRPLPKSQTLCPLPLPTVAIKHIYW